MEKYDIIVVGAGHAGIEAACISETRGLSVLLITLNSNEIGEMSCNPAIGGIAKGHLVKEIDVLGGVMAKAIDATAIQYRLLNTRKGMAVRSSRAQADHARYVEWMTSNVKGRKNITLREGNVNRLLRKGNRVSGIGCVEGSLFYGSKVIITTGTFLNGLMHIGSETSTGGRWGSDAVVSLSRSLKNCGLKLGRLKTGTPARLDKTTVNFDDIDEQRGDRNIRPFSFENSGLSYHQLPCYITFTNTKTHDIIRDNLHRSPLYTGRIRGTGPRYCPSIEDKIVRFPARRRHQIFLEPEGKDSGLIYPGGISTSMPRDVQNNFIRTIKGLEDVKIVRYGYAVEYDFVFPTMLDHSLRVRHLDNLYLAGQINGTSGYEEAAAQGLIAGINAGNELLGIPPLILKRHESYIAVLVDDLVTRGTDEPYRMFTSRAEHRLLLREDNADLRLGSISQSLGLASSKATYLFNEKKALIDSLSCFFKSVRLKPSKELQRLILKHGFPQVASPCTLLNYLAREEITFSQLKKLFHVLGITGEWEKRTENVKAERLATIWESLQTDFRLDGYIRRERARAEKMQSMYEVKLPPTLDYLSMHGLTREIREKLDCFRPHDIAEANRISGFTPAALDVLLINLKKFRECRI